MEELLGCVTKECEDVEVVCISNDVKRIGEVERGIEIGKFWDNKGVPLVTKRIQDILISEKRMLLKKGVKNIP